MALDASSGLASDGGCRYLFEIVRGERQTWGESTKDRKQHQKSSSHADDDIFVTGFGIGHRRGFSLLMSRNEERAQLSRHSRHCSVIHSWMIPDVIE
jgi:hypothetical protein